MASSLSDFRGPELNQRCGKSVGMSERFRVFDRDTLYLLPPSVQDWLPESHLARFVVEVVSKLDLGELERAYAGRGSKAYHPEMLLAMLFYGYATGVFSSRKQEQATYDSVAFRYIAANTHPDHDTIATFRKRFLKSVVAWIIPKDALSSCFSTQGITWMPHKFNAARRHKFDKAQSG